METMYFVDEQHQENFKRCLAKWHVEKNYEYMAACYIMAVPYIFEKIEGYFDTFEEPVSWIWPYEWKYTVSKEKDDEESKEEIEIPYDLTGSMVQLGKLALNLWNGYEHFNLMRCLGVMDATSYEVVKCAIKIRMGEF